MALAKIYDTADTLMVPMDLDATDSLSEYLIGAACMLDNATHVGAESAAKALRKLADDIDNARTAAGL